MTETAETTVEFRTTPTIHKIVDRYYQLCDELDVPNHQLADRLTLTMDLAAANGVNGNRRLRPGVLLRSSDFDFMHDVTGIMRHMDRLTGRLTDLFLPRCSR